MHVLVDACSSSRPLERTVALDRLRQSGALLTTVESAVFELLGDSQHPQFKALSKLVVERGKTEVVF